MIWLLIAWAVFVIVVCVFMHNATTDSACTGNCNQGRTCDCKVKINE